jgi:catechol 2,3-dioxygenase-like lactoylglutathione lyase family enzyme
MFDHLSLGVRNLVAARRFYDAALAPLGHRLLQEYPTSLAYGDGRAGLWLLAVERPVPADDRSGLHLCFGAPSRAAVDAFHEAALKAGGKDNGAPGLRADYGADYYAAFVVDPDGYRLEAYCGK